MMKVSIAQNYIKSLEASVRILENMKIELPNSFAERKVNYILKFFRIYK